MTIAVATPENATVKMAPLRYRMLRNFSVWGSLTVSAAAALSDIAGNITISVWGTSWFESTVASKANCTVKINPAAGVILLRSRKKSRAQYAAATIRGVNEERAR